MQIKSSKYLTFAFLTFFLFIAPLQSVHADECETDLTCMGNRFMQEAVEQCKALIESWATYEHRWTTDFILPIFSEFRWKDEEKRQITFVGDRIIFRSATDAWHNHIYECNYDSLNHDVMGVHVRAGML